MIDERFFISQNILTWGSRKATKIIKETDTHAYAHIKKKHAARQKHTPNEI